MASVYKLISDVAKLYKFDISGDEFSELRNLTQELPETLDASTLLTYSDASTHPKLKTHFVKNFVDGVGQNMSSSLQAAGFTQEQIDAVFEKKNFTERVEASFELFKNKTDDGKESTYKSRISTLEQENAKLKTDSDTTIKGLQSQYEAERIEESLVSEFLKQSWSDHYPAEDRADLAKVRMNKFLASNPGAKLIRDPQTKALKIVDKENPELDYLDSSNKKITFEHAITEVIAPFKKVSDQTDPNANKNQVVTPPAGGQSANQSQPHSITSSTIAKLLDGVKP